MEPSNVIFSIMSGWNHKVFCILYGKLFSCRFKQAPLASSSLQCSLQLSFALFSALFSALLSAFFSPQELLRTLRNSLEPLGTLIRNPLEELQSIIRTDRQTHRQTDRETTYLHFLCSFRSQKWSCFPQLQNRKRRHSYFYLRAFFGTPCISLYSYSRNIRKDVKLVSKFVSLLSVFCSV